MYINKEMNPFNKPPNLHFLYPVLIIKHTRTHKIHLSLFSSHYPKQLSD